jgi:hypothetical protein
MARSRIQAALAEIESPPESRPVLAQAQPDTPPAQSRIRSALEEVNRPAKPNETSAAEAALHGGASGVPVLGNFVSQGAGLLTAAIEGTAPGRWIGEKAGLLSRDAKGNLRGPSGLLERADGSTDNNLAGLVTGEQPASFGDSYRQGRDDYKQLAATAAEEHPLAFHGAGLATSVALPAAAALKGTGAVATAAQKLAKPGIAIAESALGGLARGDADLTKGEFSGAAVDTAIGAGVGVLGEVLAGATGKTAAKLKKWFGKEGKIAENHVKEIVNDISGGATPVHQRRAFPDERARKGVVELVEKSPALAKAVADRDSDAVLGIVQSNLDALSPKTLPIYKQFDEVAGPIAVEGMDRYLAAEVRKLAKSNDAQDRAVGEAVEAWRRQLQEVAEKQGTTKWTHKQIREEVTGLLKLKDQNVGTVFETLAATKKNELHAIGDKFLKQRMALEASMHPEELGALNKELTDLNKQISVNLGVKDVVENGENRQYWATKALSETAKNTAKRLVTTGLLGAAGGAAGAGVGYLQGDTGTGAAVGVAAGLGAPAAAKALTKAASKALFKLSSASPAIASAPDKLDALVQGAIKAGVPEGLIRQAVALVNRRQKPEAKQ